MSLNFIINDYDTMSSSIDFINENLFKNTIRYVSGYNYNSGQTTYQTLTLLIDQLNADKNSEFNPLTLTSDQGDTLNANINILNIDASKNWITDGKLELQLSNIVFTKISNDRSLFTNTTVTFEILHYPYVLWDRSGPKPETIPTITITLNISPSVTLATKTLYPNSKSYIIEEPLFGGIIKPGSLVYTGTAQNNILFSTAEKTFTAFQFTDQTSITYSMLIYNVLIDGVFKGFNITGTITISNSIGVEQYNITKYDPYLMRIDFKPYVFPYEEIVVDSDFRTLSDFFTFKSGSSDLWLKDSVAITNLNYKIKVKTSNGYDITYQGIVNISWPKTTFIDNYNITISANNQFSTEVFNTVYHSIGLGEIKLTGGRMERKEFFTIQEATQYTLLTASYFSAGYMSDGSASVINDGTCYSGTLTIEQYVPAVPLYAVYTYPNYRQYQNNLYFSGPGTISVSITFTGNFSGSEGDADQNSYIAYGISGNTLTYTDQYYPTLQINRSYSVNTGNIFVIYEYNSAAVTYLQITFYNANLLTFERTSEHTVSIDVGDQNVYLGNQNDIANKTLTTNLKVTNFTITIPNEDKYYNLRRGITINDVNISNMQAYVFLPGATYNVTYRIWANEPSVEFVYDFDLTVTNPTHSLTIKDITKINLKSASKLSPSSGVGDYFLIKKSTPTTIEFKANFTTNETYFTPPSSIISLIEVSSTNIIISDFESIITTTTEDNISNVIDLTITTAGEYVITVNFDLPSDSGLTSTYFNLLCIDPQISINQSPLRGPIENDAIRLYALTDTTTTTITKKSLLESLLELFSITVELGSSLSFNTQSYILNVKKKDTPSEMINLPFDITQQNIITIPDSSDTVDIVFFDGSNNVYTIMNANNEYIFYQLPDEINTQIRDKDNFPRYTIASNPTNNLTKIILIIDINPADQIVGDINIYAQNSIEVDRLLIENLSVSTPLIIVNINYSDMSFQPIFHNFTHGTNQLYVTLQLLAGKPILIQKPVFIEMDLKSLVSCNIQ